MNESDRRFLQAIKKAPLTKKKKRKRGATDKPAPKAQDAQADAIVAEMKELGLGGSLAIPFRDSDSGELRIIEPIKPLGLALELRWTAQLPLFREARESAKDAMCRLLAETQALRCSFDADSPHIEQTLFQIRAGLIALGDPRIASLVAYAQEIGQGRTIHRRIDAAMHDAERRKKRGEMLPDLNSFRLRLALFWTGLLLWLMSDEKIATFMATNRLVPAGIVCDPSAVTKARKHLRLVKSPRLLVKSVGKNLQWFFVDGYPPTEE